MDTLNWTQDQAFEFLLTKSKEIGIVKYHVNRFKDSKKYSVIYDKEKVQSITYECICIALEKFSLFQRRVNGEEIPSDKLPLDKDFSNPNKLAGYLAQMVSCEISKDYTYHSAEIRTGQEFSLDQSFDENEDFSQKNSLMNVLATEDREVEEDRVEADSTLDRIENFVKAEGGDLYKYYKYLTHPEYLGKYNDLKKAGLVTESYHLFKKKLKALSSLISKNFTQEELLSIQKDIQNKYNKVLKDKKEFPKIECEIVESFNSNLKDNTLSAEVYLSVNYNNKKYKIDSVTKTIAMTQSEKEKNKLKKQLNKFIPNLEEKYKLISDIRLTKFNKELKKIKKQNDEKRVSVNTVKETINSLCL